MALSIQGQVVDDAKTARHMPSLDAKRADTYTTPCFDDDGTRRCRQNPFKDRTEVPAVEARRADDSALSTVLPIICRETDIVVPMGVGALRVLVDNFE